MPNNLGAKIRAARVKKSMTQEDLARITNTTKQNIYKYENGIITNIPLDKLEAIAAALSVDPAELAGWKNETREGLSAPKTLEARIVSFGMDNLPESERQKILALLQVMYNNNPDLFKRSVSNDDA